MLPRRLMDSGLALLVFFSVPPVNAAAALSSRQTVTAGTARTSLRQKGAADVIDAAAKISAGVVTFGPGKCLSTWRNADGHCEIETKCKEHDLSKYSVKLICVDDDNQKVRHVFAHGSFDSEEQFDTLIECKKCLADKEEKVEAVADEAEGDDADKNSSAKEISGADLGALKQSVKQLEAFMMNTSEQLQKLNKEVYGGGFKPKFHAFDPAKRPGDIGKAAAAKALKPKADAAAASLVHHDTARHRRSLPLQEEIDAKRLRRSHRRHLEAGDDHDERQQVQKVVETKEAPAPEAAVSLAGALRSAEVRDSHVPAQQPARSPMNLPKVRPPVRRLPAATAEPAVRKSLSQASRNAKDTDDEDNKDDDDDDDDDEKLAQEDGEKLPPSMSALQRGGDEDDNGDDEDTEDAQLSGLVGEDRDDEDDDDDS